MNEEAAHPSLVRESASDLGAPRRKPSTIRRGSQVSSAMLGDFQGDFKPIWSGDRWLAERCRWLELFALPLPLAILAELLRRLLRARRASARQQPMLRFSESGSRELDNSFASMVTKTESMSKKKAAKRKRQKAAKREKQKAAAEKKAAEELALLQADGMEASTSAGMFYHGEAKVCFCAVANDGGGECLPFALSQVC
eukprot:7376364-Prymnesium_polylepis.2